MLFLANKNLVLGLHSRLSALFTRMVTAHNVTMQKMHPTESANRNFTFFPVINKEQFMQFWNDGTFIGYDGVYTHTDSYDSVTAGAIDILTNRAKRRLTDLTKINRHAEQGQRKKFSNAYIQHSHRKNVLKMDGVEMNDYDAYLARCENPAEYAYHAVAGPIQPDGRGKAIIMVKTSKDETAYFYVKTPGAPTLKR